MNTVKTIGERIRQARDARGWSQDELARMVGYKNQSAIGNLENRKDGTGGNRIEKIAAALNVSVDWLFKGPDSDQVPFLPPKEPLNPAAQYTTLASEPTEITHAFWPFRISAESFRRLITLENLELLNRQIESMVSQREQGVEQRRQIGNGA